MPDEELRGGETAAALELHLEQLERSTARFDDQAAARRPATTAARGRAFAGASLARARKILRRRGRAS
jgi:hypothetical protein